MLLAVSGSAHAQSSDAVQKCKATAVQPGVGADVAETNLFDFFTSVQADDGSAEEVLCGDGKTWGAVHIEVKHRVHDWAVTRRCMSVVMSRGESRPDGDKRRWIYTWEPGRSARVVAGTNGMITSYPWDSGSEASWAECARQ